MQRALLQWGKPENASIVRKALRLCGREDLIGYGDGCLVRPENNHGFGYQGEAPEKRRGVERRGVSDADGKGHRRGSEQHNKKSSEAEKKHGQTHGTRAGDKNYNGGNSKKETYRSPAKKSCSGKDSMKMDFTKKNFGGKGFSPKNGRKCDSRGGKR